jgi:hypothetical protein
LRLFTKIVPPWPFAAVADASSVPELTIVPPSAVR